MLIDSHSHLKHGDALKTEYSSEQIVKIMDAVGIDKSIVFAMSTSTLESIYKAKDAADKFPDRLIPYAYAIPSYNSIVLDQLEMAISELGFRGIKIHAGECTLAHYVIDPLIEFAGERDVPCLIDCSGRYEPIEDMAKKFPDARIIVAHLGRYLCRDKQLIDRFISMAENYENIFLDVSGVVLTIKIREAVEKIGSERVIFGIDGPHESPDTVTFARTEISKIRDLNLNSDDEVAVLGGSISKLLRI